MAEDNVAAKGSISARASLGGKYLTFKLGHEEYGLEILKVQEIIKMMEITKIPKTPPYIRGVINLRGKVIPVLDMRKGFEMEEVDETDKTCIIVVQLFSGQQATIMGTIVDEVCEVMDIPADAIEPAPEMGMAMDTQFILGIAKSGNAVRMLLNVDKVLSIEELKAITSLAK
ncbi:MAG: purine-binding chemotaxis protein CheW [Spartobacteria bacterium]|nr:purine-binding chemotaxis protein CheW [Spartobacteria bacterium]